MSPTATHFSITATRSAKQLRRMISEATNRLIWDRYDEYIIWVKSLSFWDGLRQFFETFCAVWNISGKNETIWDGLRQFLSWMKYILRRLETFWANLIDSKVIIPYVNKFCVTNSLVSNLHFYISNVSFHYMFVLISSLLFSLLSPCLFLYLSFSSSSNVNHINLNCLIVILLMSIDSKSIGAMSIVSIAITPMSIVSISIPSIAIVSISIFRWQSS